MLYRAAIKERTTVSGGWLRCSQKIYDKKINEAIYRKKKTTITVGRSARLTLSGTVKGKEMADYPMAHIPP